MRVWGATVFGVLLAGVVCGAGETATIAHRGGATFAPENTIPAILAHRDCSDYIEIDVYESADGELVVIHDQTLDRTTDGSGPVGEATLEELKALDAGSWFAAEYAGTRIPTLEEALAAIGTDTIPLIEQKTGSAALYVQALQRLGRTTDVLVQSFDWGFLKAVRRYAPEIPLAALGSGALTEEKVLAIQGMGVPRIAWARNDITPEMVEFIHGVGMMIFVWTVNGTEIQQYLDYGVDGIITDDPCLVSDLTDMRPSGRGELAEGLVSYWALDDGGRDVSALRAEDWEGDNDGVLSGPGGGPSWQEGVSAKFGGALFMNGEGQCVEIGPDRSLDLNSTSVSISLWVKLMWKPSAIPESFAGIFDSATDCYVLYEDRGNGELRFKVTDGDGRAARPGVPEGALRTGVWHHVVGVCDGEAGLVSGQALIYLDGRLMDVHTGADGLSGRGLRDFIKAGQAAAVGRNGVQDVYRFRGTVDDIALWRRALRAGEVRQIYESGMIGSALMERVMSLRVVEMVPVDGGRIQLSVRVDHGRMEPERLRVETAGSGDGPFVADAGAVVTWGEAGLLTVLKDALMEREYIRLGW